MMRWALKVALSLGLIFAGHVAVAHALLERAVPPVGGTVAKAPTDVTIVFSETVEPAFSSIVVTNAAGNRVDTGKAQTASEDAKRLVVGVKALRPGTYTVTWHATSTDTHRTQGHFSFTVAR